MINTSAPEIVQVDIPSENTQSNPEIVIRVDNTTIEVVFTGGYEAEQEL